ncbi:hypothetical protein COO60DRAFT_664586 [Scenedesmus sp. NREL 46B-D3]|nr:hypothetical protein COO60DRAFT_664586 [Scenedesmus sp. NREL 46B-D3]
MEQQHSSPAEHGSVLRPKASLLPKINTAAIKGRLLQRNASAGGMHPGSSKKQCTAAAVHRIRSCSNHIKSPPVSTAGTAPAPAAAVWLSTAPLQAAPACHGRLPSTASAAAQPGVLAWTAAAAAAAAAAAQQQQQLWPEPPAQCCGGRCRAAAGACGWQRHGGAGEPCCGELGDAAAGGAAGSCRQCGQQR